MKTLAVLAFTLLLAACGGGAADLLETAEFEELQKNTAHARELYEEIVRTYPGTPEATKAQERLKELATVH